MTLEVELKFPLAQTVAESVWIERLEALGAVRGQRLAQRDRYYNHPGRDFAETDEAFRLRETDGELGLTYKGPTLAGRAKSRLEIEVPLAGGTSGRDDVEQLLERLGFRPVRDVVKSRLPFQLGNDDHDLEIVLDQVDGLGLYLEIEAQPSAEAQRESAEDVIWAIAGKLGLAEIERRSYLELLLAADE